MADISKIAYILSNASPEVLTALRNIVYAIQDISTSGGGLSPTGSDIGATAQAQAFTNGVQTQEIKDSSAVSAIAVDARVLRDAVGANNIDFSDVPVFLGGLKSDNINDVSTGANLISSDGVTNVIGANAVNTKIKAATKVLGFGDPDSEGIGNSITIDNDANEITISAPSKIKLNGLDLASATITAADLASPTFELVIEIGFVKTFTP